MANTVRISILGAAVCLLLGAGSAQAQTFARTYGGTKNDGAQSVAPTSDGGFAVAGYTGSFGVGADFWILKADAKGNVGPAFPGTWQKLYRGGGNEFANSIVQTSDGGFAVAGWTDSFGAGNGDYYVLRLDASGNILWKKTFGGASYEEARSIVQTSDGGFALAGFTYSFGAGGWDYWVLKLDASGAVQWQKTFGAASDDFAYSIAPASDGGFAVAGYSYSFGAGDPDFWILKLNSLGGVAWQKTFGGTGFDVARSIAQTSDGGFAVAGQTSSFGAGDADIWVLKLDPVGGVSLGKGSTIDRAVLTGQSK